MKPKQRVRIRNASVARKSFVTKKAETKINELANLFQVVAAPNWLETKKDVLTRELYFTGFHYLSLIRLIYNWENRFLSVNYNLQMEILLLTNSSKFERTKDCHIILKCSQKGFKKKRNYSWEFTYYDMDKTKLEAYKKRLNNSLILERLDALDITEMEIQHRDSWNYWQISCESIIGSATWIFMPPVFSMITPRLEECIKFLELYELLGDALVNNKVSFA